jgi:CrcB protein
MGGITTGFPFGTLVSNVLAGFLCGAFMYLKLNSTVLSPTVAVFLTTGIMGGLSTFSTFSVETVELFKNSRYVLASLNVIGNLALCLAFAVLGMEAAKRFVD